MGTAGVGVLIVSGVIAFGAPNRTWTRSLQLHLQAGYLLAYVGAGGLSHFILGISLFLSCFIFCTRTDGGHSGMGRSDVVFSLRFSRLGSVASRRGK